MNRCNAVLDRGRLLSHSCGPSVDGDARWRHLAKTIECCLCGGDTTLCQIILIAYCNKLFLNRIYGLEQQ